MLAWAPSVRLAPALFLAGAAALSGCEPRFEVELVEVVSAEPARLDAGHRLEVGGHRFLLGHPCTFVLRGAWHRPGAPVEVGEHEISGEAITSELAEATITDDVIDDLGGRSTFVGDIDVRFAAASIPRGFVHGVLRDVALDFVPATRTHASRGDIEAALGAHFGEPADEPGAEITHVEPGGILANLGLESGDRIVAFGGLHVLTPGDLALDPRMEPSSLVLSVMRGDGPEIEVRGAAAPYDAAALGPMRGHQLAVLLAVLALGLALGAGARERRPNASGHVTTPAHALASVAIGLALARAIEVRWLTDLGSVIGFIVLVLLLGAAAERNRDPFSIVLASGRAMALVAVALATAALAGTTELGILAAHASGDASSWPGLGSAIAPATAIALVVGCTRPQAAEASRLAATLDVLVVAIVCALAATLLFGGATVTDVPSAFALVARLLVVTAAIGVGRSALGTLPRGAIAGLGVASAALCAFASYRALVEPLPAEVAAAVAQTMIAALVLGLVLTLARRVRPAAIDRDLDL